MGSPNLPSAVLESNRRKQLVCGKLLQYVAKEEQKAGCFHLQVQLCAHQRGGAQGCSLLTYAVFVQLGPVAANRVSWSCVCVCFPGCLPCAVLQRVMPSAAVQLPRKVGGVPQSPAPTGPAMSEGQVEKQRKTQVPKQQVMKEIGLLFTQHSCFFIPPAFPFSHLLPSPRPCLAKSTLWYKGLKSQNHFHSVGTKDFLCCNSSVQLWKRPLRGAQQHVPCVTGTKAGYCGDG